jgi:hypothetical protein
MTFVLQSELTINNGNTEEKNLYETVFLVEPIEKRGKNATFYDKEMKMYFQDESALMIIYEIELYKICLILSEILDKANDFTRRVMLRYDWIQAKVKNSQGKAVGVENIAELQSTWQSIKGKILEDYEGEAVCSYLDEVDMQMSNPDTILSTLSQYFFFGLLFPGIPPSHQNEWSSKRVVELSDYEEEKFQETITFDKTIDNQRIYRIAGNPFPNSERAIENFSGWIGVQKGEILPFRAEVKVDYRILDKSYRWVFKLEQY